MATVCLAQRQAGGVLVISLDRVLAASLHIVTCCREDPCVDRTHLFSARLWSRQSGTGGQARICCQPPAPNNSGCLVQRRPLGANILNCRLHLDSRPEVLRRCALLGDHSVLVTGHWPALCKAQALGSPWELLHGLARKAPAIRSWSCWRADSWASGISLSISF